MGVPVPYADQWEFVRLIEKMFLHNLTVNDLWVQLAGEPHRGFFPKLIMIILAYHTGWNIKWELYTNFVLVIITLLVLLSLLRKSFSSKPPLWLTLSLSIILFSSWQWENWIWGWQIHIFLCVLGATITIWSLDRWTDRFEGILIGSIAAVVASYSYFIGLLIWIVVLPMLLQKKRRNWLHISYWALSFAATVYIYFLNLTSSITQHLIHWHDIDKIVIHILICLGAPVVYPPSPSIIMLPFFAGIILLTVETALLVHIFIRKEDNEPLLPWIVLALFAFLSTSAISLGRYEMGMPASSRYTTISQLFLISTFVTFGVWSKAYLGTCDYIPKISIPFKVFVIFSLISVFMFSSLSGNFRMFQYSRYRYDSWLELRKFPNTHDACLLNVYPLGNIIRTRIYAEKLSDMGFFITNSVSNPEMIRDISTNQSCAEFYEAIKNTTEDSSSYLKMVKMFIINGNIKAASETLQRISIINPKSFEAIYNAAIKRSRHDKDKVNLLLLQIIEGIKPSDPKIDYEIAGYYSRMNKTEEAIIYLETAFVKGFKEIDSLQSDPDFENIRRTPSYSKIIKSNNIGSPLGIRSMIHESIDFYNSIVDRVHLL